MSFLLVFSVGAVLGGFVRCQDAETTAPLLTPTSFSCHDRPPGYYADLETGCKTYHVCDGNSHFTYICPRRTLFQQRSRICDHQYLVRCQDSPYFFGEEGEGEEESGTTSSENAGDAHTQAFESTTTETTSPAPEESSEIPGTTPTPTPPSASKESSPAESFRKFLSFRLRDFRSLFFIPEVESNSIAATPERELVLPVGSSDFMKFRAWKKSPGPSPPCPSHCDPRFYHPETCHPCIMLK